MKSIEISKYIAIPNSGSKSEFEFTISSLRPKEKKWLGPALLIKPLKDSFDIETAKSLTINYLEKLVDLTDNKQDFINHFKNNKYRPELLFDDENIITAIKHHPMALWRCRNGLEV